MFIQFILLLKYLSKILSFFIDVCKLTAQHTGSKLMTVVITLISAVFIQNKIYTSEVDLLILPCQLLP